MAPDPTSNYCTVEARVCFALVLYFFFRTFDFEHSFFFTIFQFEIKLPRLLDAMLSLYIPYDHT